MSFQIVLNNARPDLGTTTQPLVDVLGRGEHVAEAREKTRLSAQMASCPTRLLFWGLLGEPRTEGVNRTLANVVWMDCLLVSRWAALLLGGLASL